MTLPLDFERTPERVGALVAMMLGLGYTIGATAPFVLGAVRDATGSFDAVLWLAAGFLAAQFFVLLALTRRHAETLSGVSRDVRPEVLVVPPPYLVVRRLTTMLFPVKTL